MSKYATRIQKEMEREIEKAKELSTASSEQQALFFYGKLSKIVWQIIDELLSEAGFRGDKYDKQRYIETIIYPKYLPTLSSGAVVMTEKILDVIILDLTKKTKENKK